MRITRINTKTGPEFVAEVEDGYRRLPIPTDRFDDLVRMPSKTHPGDLIKGERLAPLAPGKIVAIGLNYFDHIREANSAVPTAPLIFTKFTSSVIGDGHPIVFDPNVVRRVDWEVELAAVIGTRARNVTTDNALSHVFGYTIANDISAREAQFADGQWVRGKSLDTFCPIGPVIVTSDEIPDPQVLGLGTRVNGLDMQRSNTKEMVFSVAEIISYCSQFFTLEPGDLVLTGTPWGCGEFMSPQRSLGNGDLVETWIQQIGSISNRVRAVAEIETTLQNGEYVHS